MTAGTVFDVRAETFQRDVVERSAATPVLLDFWAEWCGPCRTLGPILEKIAVEFGGSFALGKVDTERERDLAQAFQVQGIPYCVLIDGGRPVDAFQGALRETEVRRFLQRNAIGPVGAKSEVAAETKVDPASPEARLQRALQWAKRGDAAAARRELAAFPEDDARIDTVRRLEDGLAFLEAPLAESAGGVEKSLALARRTLLAGDAEGAMEGILAVVGQDKTFRGGLARKAMLLCFLLVGDDDERVDAYRRRLATLLY